MRKKHGKTSVRVAEEESASIHITKTPTHYKTYTHTHTYIHTYIDIYTHTYIHTHTQIHTYTFFPLKEKSRLKKV